MDITKELLTQLYVVDELSTAKIAKHCGCCAEIIRRNLHKFGIPPRPARGHGFPKGHRHRISKEDLEREYHQNGKTQSEIAKLFGCGETLISNMMLIYDIPSRPRQEHLKGREKTLEHRMNLSKAHMGKRTGPDNNKWKGGVSTDHTAIRRRTEHTNWRNWVLRVKGNVCEECGKDLNAQCHCCGHRPDKHVHHIKDFANHPELRSDINNALVLCDACHKAKHIKKGTIS